MQSSSQLGGAAGVSVGGGGVDVGEDAGAGVGDGEGAGYVAQLAREVQAVALYFTGPRQEHKKPALLHLALRRLLN
jgi:hypothetical protein